MSQYSSMNETQTGALAKLLDLKPGRHYGGSPQSNYWTMIGRNLRDVEEWEIVPPAASLTYAWGTGGCELSFNGGSFTMGQGDWMWIDAGFAHHGRNQPGSNFLTVFFPGHIVKNAGLHLAPIGACVQKAQSDLSQLLASLAIALLGKKEVASFDEPVISPLLDWVGCEFPPFDGERKIDQPIEEAANLMRNNPLSNGSLTDLAKTVGISTSELSRRFTKRYKLNPINYRKQLRLVLATRSLATGLTVSSAAYQAGFSDAAHLSRTFKKQYGVTPTAWSAQICAG